MPQDWDKEKTMKAIYNAHKMNGLLPGGQISYHWVIGNNWEAEGRAQNTVGYHAGNWLANLSSVAICLNGNFQNDQPTDYQKEKLTAKIMKFMEYYGLEKKSIKLHRNFTATACPGRNIDLPLIFDLIDQAEDADMIGHITEYFIKIWNTFPAPGDYAYFKKRIEQETIENKIDLIEKMTYWYGIVYPKGRLDKEGDNQWQKEKQKVLKK